MCPNYSQKMERKYPNHVLRILKVALEGLILIFTFLVNAFITLFHKIIFLEVSINFFLSEIVYILP